MVVTHQQQILKIMLRYILSIIFVFWILTESGFGYQIKEGVEENEGIPVQWILADKRMRSRMHSIPDEKKKYAIQAAIIRFGSPSVATDRQIIEQVIVLADGDPLITAWALFTVDMEARNKMLQVYKRLEDLPILANLLYDISFPDWYSAAGGEMDSDAAKHFETLFQQIHSALGIAVPERSMPSSRRRSGLLKWLEDLLLSKRLDSGLDSRGRATIESILTELKTIKEEQKNPPGKR